ncbi:MULTISPECIES: acyl-CoA dehydrogenase family protein [Mycobacteriaceae]|uniref:Acyl-CoA dehydrogenase family protein n=1 Tax=Mycolicibacterium parafortuitum TaxID=39692 RepID=A0ACC6MNJ6_MYCPF|nr:MULTISPECIES: acyl-CoA dehydrogenase [Mycobacteriaceae]MDZ5088508.1 acyl-CoA dehydrogenase family protein [Mycolicibacterium parafortuitum]GFM16585.1 acyl-CoA dehydrogenase [Mycobacterium sp. PO1]GFM26286.1 acyl-CoA dehydrogenase [Mycobacterium sp. PO2]
MHIGLTAEQEMLRDTTARLATSMATDNADDVASGDRLDGQWRRIVDLGLPALRAPESCGLDASGVEIALALEELGRALTAVPVLGQAVLTTELLHAAGADKEVELVAEGTLRMAPVLAGDLADFADSVDNGIAVDTAGATSVLFAVRDGDNRRLTSAALTAAVSDAGLDLTRSVRTVAADELDSATPLGDPISADRWMSVQALALTAVAADLVGVMAGALDDAVRYAGERVQFGVKIGTFQAVQHLLADSLVRMEGARSCVWHAAWAVDHLPADQALLAARTAKAYASASGRDVVETAMQVLGGISITWEHAAHLRLRRTLLNRRLFGDESVQYAAIADMRLTDRELS